VRFNTTFLLYQSVLYCFALLGLQNSTLSIISEILHTAKMAHGVVHLLVSLSVLLSLCGNLAFAQLGSWREEAVPTTVTEFMSENNPIECLCAPDPILPSPQCIFCYCSPDGSAPPDIVLPVNSTNSTALERCGTGSGDPTLLYAPDLIGGEFEKLDCLCSTDPWFGEPWLDCICPLAGGKELVPAPPSSGPTLIPTSKIYSNYPAAENESPPYGDWPLCFGEFALCSFANCTRVFKGKNNSDIGESLADCGCTTSNDYNDITAFNLVDPPFILQKDVYEEYEKTCGGESSTSACTGPNSAGVCDAIVNNTIYGGSYDLVSTYSYSPKVGGFDIVCPGEPGVVYANCMTSACYRRVAFDGSPITCYCPLYEANEAFAIGSRNGTVPPCSPEWPYVLSGAPNGTSTTSDPSIASGGKMSISIFAKSQVGLGQVALATVLSGIVLSF